MWGLQHVCTVVRERETWSEGAAPSLWVKPHLDVEDNVFQLPLAPRTYVEDNFEGGGGRPTILCPDVLDEGVARKRTLK